MLYLARLATRIGIIKVGALGDVVRTTSLLPALRRAHPDMALTWITCEAALPLVAGNPDVAQPVTLESDDHRWRLANYDWLISLDDDESLCRLASMLKTSRLSGAYWTGAERAYTADVEEWFGMGLLRPASAGGIERANQLKRQNSRTYAQLLYSGLGLPGPIARPYIPIPALARREARQWVRAHQLKDPLVALNTGAGARWRFKSWGEDQTAALARHLADSGVSVMVVGGAGEAERNRRIVAAADRESVCAAPTDLDLLSFAALIDQCNVYVTSDSLGLHLATALSKRIVAFFGPTSAAEIDLYGLGEKIVTPLGCRTCYLRDCDVRPHCMQSIPESQILDATLRLLAPVSNTSVVTNGYGV